MAYMAVAYIAMASTVMASPVMPYRVMAYRVKACIGKSHVVMACIGAARTRGMRGLCAGQFYGRPRQLPGVGLNTVIVMAYIIMTYKIMASIVMAYIDMAYMGLECIVLAYRVTAWPI